MNETTGSRANDRMTEFPSVWMLGLTASAKCKASVLGSPLRISKEIAPALPPRNMRREPSWKVTSVPNRGITTDPIPCRGSINRRFWLRAGVDSRTFIPRTFAAALPSWNSASAILPAALGSGMRSRHVGPSSLNSGVLNGASSSKILTYGSLSNVTTGMLYRFCGA